MLLCKTCDAEVQPGQIFCVNCGARTEGNTYMSDAAPAPLPSSDATVPLNHAAVPADMPVAPTVPVAPVTVTPPTRDPFLVDAASPTPFQPASSSAGPSYYPTPSALPTSTLAVVSLIFGILGVVQLLPLISPLIAIITGHMARREIRASGGRVQGNGMALTGLILGYALLLLGVLACGLFSLFVLAEVLGA